MLTIIIREQSHMPAEKKRHNHGYSSTKMTIQVWNEGQQIDVA